MCRKILVTTEGSSLSDKAVRCDVDLAAALKAKLIRRAIVSDALSGPLA